MGPTPTIGFVNLQEKFSSLERILKKLGKVVVAYSGGVDSTFLLKAAVDTLGAENVLACIGVSASLAESQYNQAIEGAKTIGAKVLETQVDEVEDSKYAANKADRCFHCKSHLYGILTNIAKEKNFNCVICGCNFDDKDDFRPGNRAAEVFGVGCPLMEAELTKDDIRKLSKQMNLPTADVPASPCLASRVSYGLEITEQRLKQVEEAEDFLRSLGLVEFRVRHHDTIARLEVNPQDIEKVTIGPVRSQIVEKLKTLGFKFVTVDLQGFRSGSLNEPLSEEEKRKSL
ncbi:MAG: ATP-dependent sacrificial sulfur transferase LarE [Planctomycetota bacterium]